MQALHAYLQNIRIHLYPETSVQVQTSSKSPPPSISMCIDLFQQGNLEQATNHLLDFIQENPEHQLAYAYLAFTCASRGLEEDAHVFIAHAGEISPLLPAYYAGLGEAFLKGGNAQAASQYLEHAITEQPDLFAAYPALAKAMRQKGQYGEAIQLLESVASIPSDAQDTILGLLLQWLTHAGDITAIVRICSRIRNNLAYNALGLALSPRTNLPPEHITESVKTFLAGLYQANPLPVYSGTPLTIAFLASNCHQESIDGRLETLLLNLPPSRFKTIVLWNDPRDEEEVIQRSGLISDHVSVIAKTDDVEVLNEIAPMHVQVLIDMDGLGIRNRIPLFLAAPVPVKLSWSDTAFPLLSGITCLHGEALWPESESERPPGLRLLPGTGECQTFPEQAILPRAAAKPFTFGCLCLPSHYDENSWHTYAKLLLQAPSSRLLVNLGDLAEDAQRFISEHFRREGIDLARLDFIHVTAPGAIAAAWNSVDLGLAPLHGPGDAALPIALWMEKPYLAIASAALWSRRPAAMLRTLNQEHYIAHTLDDWMSLGRELTHSFDTRLTGIRQTMIRQGFSAPTDKFAFSFAELIEKLHRELC